MIIVKAEVNPITEINGNQIIKQIERIARTCYKSEDKITNDNSSAIAILKLLTSKNHSAMLEHFNISMNYVSNIAVYKDLTRHRHASFAVESTRFCNYSKDKFNNNIKFLKPIEINENTEEYNIWLRSMEYIEKEYLNMAKLGARPDQLSLLLPQSTAAEFNITANLREWLHIFNLRAIGPVRPAVKEIMIPTLILFHKNIPIIYDEVYNEYLNQINN